MLRLDVTDLRAALRNCSRGDAQRMAPPPDLADLDWDQWEVLGWRDPKAPLRGYLVAREEDEVLGALLRAPESRMSARRAAMCLLCGCVGQADAFALFVAPRPRSHGDSVGTYVCADLRCSANLRAESRDRPGAPGTLEDRAAELHAKTLAFLRLVYEKA